VVIALSDISYCMDGIHHLGNLTGKMWHVIFPMRLLMNLAVTGMMAQVGGTLCSLL
jgi:hypothetical protein